MIFFLGSETKIFFTPFIFDPIIDMNIVTYFSTRIYPPKFLVEHFSNINNNNKLYNYIIYIYNNEERKKTHSEISSGRRG